MIEVRNLTKRFGKLTVLDDISTSFASKEVVSIIGPSGGGKSTFLRCLNLLETPTSGQIVFDGVDICDRKVDIDRHRQKMGMVFQQFNPVSYTHLTLPTKRRRRRRSWCAG